MGRQSSHNRRWTAAEDAAIRQSAFALGRLADLAGPGGRIVGRSYVRYPARVRLVLRVRFGVPRLDPAQRAARGPSEIPCRYCGGAFLASGGRALLLR